MTPQTTIDDPIAEASAALSAMASAGKPAATERFVEPGWGVGEATDLDKKVPDQIADMRVTPELRAMYAGFPELLLVRATFSKRCRKPWDAINMCMRQQLDHETCTEVFKSWRPCEDEMRRKRIKAARAAEDEQRRQLTERSKRG